jgi:hypothetical protein
MARQAFTVAVAERSAQVVPAQQRFDARGFKRVQRHLRLVHEQQVTGLDRTAQRLLETEAVRGHVIQFRRI